MSEVSDIEQRCAPCKIEELRRFSFCPRSLYWTQRTSNLPLPREHTTSRSKDADLRDLFAALEIEPTSVARAIKLASEEWVGKLDLLLGVGEESIPVIVKLGHVTRGHEADALQLMAYATLLASRPGRITRGVVWYLEYEDVFEVELDGELAKRLAEVHEAMRAQRVSSRFPSTHASAQMCVVCPFINLCDDDLWHDRGESGAAEFFRNELVIIG